MRRISLLIAFASVCLVPSLALAQDLVDGFEGRTFQGTKGVTLPYRLFKVNSPTAGMKYPLIMFLHGAGERGSDNTAQLNANMGAKVWATAAHQAAHPAYVIAPQCPNGQQWVDTDWTLGSYSTDSVPISDELTTALELADEVGMEFDTDPARQYITGLSMGGYGTWDAVIRNPLRFAAAIPVCGAGDPSKVDLIKDLPIWTAHGDADTTVPPSGSRDMVMALETAGSDIQYSEYPGVGHDAWSQTYANEDIVTWLFTNQRPSPPLGGSGGAGGMGGAAGSAGADAGGAGGMAAGAGGAGGAAGTASMAGAATTAGSTSAGAATAGSSGSGAVMSGTTPPADDSGCQVHAPAAPTGTRGGLLVLAGLLGWTSARRRR